MKKKICKKFLGFLLSALLVLAVSLPAFADMGPKPSVELKLYVYNDQNYAVTLLGNTESTGPWSAPNDYQDWMGSRSVWEAFKNYDAPEGYYFLGYFKEYFGDTEQTFTWGYYPPQKFYVLLYNMDTGMFSLSREAVERYAFDSTWQVLFDTEDGDLRVYTNRDDGDLISFFAARLLITLMLELGLGAAVFGLREKTQQNLIGGVNLATQLALNLALHYGLFYLGPWAGFALYAGMEILVFAVEAFVYCRWLPWPEGRKPHPVLYALAANLLSFGVGWALNEHLTNFQLRWLALGCLLVWYTAPRLAKKAASFKQNAQEIDKKL